MDERGPFISQLGGTLRRDPGQVPTRKRVGQATQQVSHGSGPGTAEPSAKGKERKREKEEKKKKPWGSGKRISKVDGAMRLSEGWACFIRDSLSILSLILGSSLMHGM